ncbi:MAG TPA: hypothetical protein VF322_04285 [Gammaproteobacteria bacterium]
MEVVLLWLDDLDDLLFAAVARAERLRRHCLRIGLAAAVVLVLSELAVVTPAWAPVCAAVAAASAGLWIAAAAYRLLARPAPRRLTA